MKVKELNSLLKYEYVDCIFVSYKDHKLEYFYDDMIEDNTEIEDYLYLNIDEYNEIFNHDILACVDRSGKILVVRIEHPLVYNKQGISYVFNEIINYMDKNICAELEKNNSTCNKQKYFDEYLKAYKLKYGEEWKFPKLKGV